MEKEGELLLLRRRVGSVVPCPLPSSLVVCLFGSKKGGRERIFAAALKGGRGGGQGCAEGEREGGSASAVGKEIRPGGGGEREEGGGESPPFDSQKTSSLHYCSGSECGGG